MTNNSIRRRLAPASVFLMAFLLLGLSTVSAKPAAVPENFQADFTATMKIGKQGDLDLTFDGKIIHAGNDTRIQFRHPLTMEDIVLLLSSDDKLATLLYPDTLNGMQFSYAGKYYEEWPANFAEFLTVESERKPAGWTKKVGNTDSAGNRVVTISKGEMSVSCTVSGTFKPLDLHVVTSNHTADFDISNYTELDTVDQQQFAIPSDYALEEVKSLGDDSALPL